MPNSSPCATNRLLYFGACVFVLYSKYSDGGVGGIIIVGALERACTCIVATYRENRPLGLVCSWAAPRPQVNQAWTDSSACSGGVVSFTVSSEDRFVSALYPCLWEPG